MLPPKFVPKLGPKTMYGMALALIDEVSIPLTLSRTLIDEVSITALNALSSYESCGSCESLRSPAPVARPLPACAMDHVLPLRQLVSEQAAAVLNELRKEVDVARAMARRVLLGSVTRIARPVSEAE